MVYSAIVLQTQKNQYQGCTDKHAWIVKHPQHVLYTGVYPRNVVKSPKCMHTQKSLYLSSSSVVPWTLPFHFSRFSTVPLRRGTSRWTPSRGWRPSASRSTSSAVTIREQRRRRRCMCHRHNPQHRRSMDQAAPQWVILIECEMVGIETYRTSSGGDWVAEKCRHFRTIFGVFNIFFTYSTKQVSRTF